MGFGPAAGEFRGSDIGGGLSSRASVVGLFNALHLRDASRSANAAWLLLSTTDQKVGTVLEGHGMPIRSRP